MCQAVAAASYIGEKQNWKIVELRIYDIWCQKNAIRWLLEECQCLSFCIVWIDFDVLKTSENTVSCLAASSHAVCDKMGYNFCRAFRQNSSSCQSFRQNCQSFRRSSRRSAIIQKLPVKTAAKKLAKSKVRPPLLEPHYAMSRLVDF